MALHGDTLRLCAKFYGWDGELAWPDSVSCCIYDQRKQKIADGIPIRDEENECYYFDYSCESKGIYYFEFKGILEGTASLNRGRFTVQFIEP